ncbi:MAG: hypothetical protein M0R22_10950 [Dehalococcoidia bacterium]|jgi:hypothetical protein|nr:hypothetical protein [Dehalococcoidia bacterium]
MTAGAVWPFNRRRPDTAALQPGNRLPAVNMAGEVAKYFAAAAGGAISAQSACAVSAATALPDRCINMSDEDFRRFALALANCHLEQSGRRTYAVAADMDDAAWLAYTTVLLHTDSLCRQLQQDIRAAAVDRALGATAEGIARLGESSDRTLARLDAVGEATARAERATAQLAEDSEAALGFIAKTATDAAEAQDRFAEAALGALGGISETVTVARQGIDSIVVSHAEIAESVAAVAGSAAEADVRQRQLLVIQRELADEQRRMAAVNREILGSLTRLAWLQSAIFGEVMGIGATVWYVCAAVVCGIATSADRTAGARARVFASLAASLCLERVALAVSPVAEFAPMVSMTCRALFAGLVVLAVLWSAVTHRDYRKAMYEQLAILNACIASLADAPRH